MTVVLPDPKNPVRLADNDSSALAHAGPTIEDGAREVQGEGRTDVPLGGRLDGMYLHSDRNHLLSLGQSPPFHSHIFMKQQV